ncbi:DUF4989 domain-containing protein [Dysgonomonas sp. 511]|uniref:DUF4989 domain-containing protein n=1 Tax=Dysgonomonas sp. 511 TaxID=2302930 RepID=UPI0013D015CC|nr:DUF4989 domain-containing protein [Dysgonomonas sp. 511]NDV79300.1 DUF4989 domain-containing protein [Dysgonomonas sp. 511]
MKYYKLFFALIVSALFALMSCDDDEKLGLQPFPDNQPSVSISDAGEGTELVLNAVYNSDGILELDDVVSRTYMFRFKASPEDINLSYEILSENIPADLIEISTTKETLKVGHTDTYVTVTLKEEDFSFAQTNYDEETYEIGVRVRATGYKTPVDPIEAKVIVKKEAYIPTASIVGEEGSSTIFGRAYSNGAIVNPDPIAYKFTVQLDKPALKTTKVKFTTTGIEDKFMNTVTITPAEVTIQAGEKTSAVVTWGITDDFLLQTTEEESHEVTVAFTADDPIIALDETNGVAVLKILKVFRNIQYLAEKDPAWVNIEKLGWTGSSIVPVGKNISSIINGYGGTGGSSLYVSSDELSFYVDMGAAKTFVALGADYYRNTTASSPKNMKISTSMDNVDWTSQGELETPQSLNHYFGFYVPVTARYVKFEMTGRYNSYLDVTEIWVYE